MKKYFVDTFNVELDEKDPKNFAKIKAIAKKYGIKRGGGMQHGSAQITESEIKSLIKDFNKMGATGSFVVKNVDDWERTRITLNKKESGFMMKDFSKGGITKLLNTKVKLF